MEGFARGNLLAYGPTKGDPSAGVIPALRSLLAACPGLGACVGGCFNRTDGWTCSFRIS